MNSETFDPNNVKNHDQQRKRKALDPLTEIVNQHHQVQLQYAPEIGNIEQQQPQQCDSPVNYINNVRCQCGCHAVETNDDMDALYLDTLPVGYRFEPTDKELITHYLLRKIRNENLPKNKISVATVYGEHPKDIVGNYPQAKEGEWYFFTSRKKKYPNGKRPDRKAGRGYWKVTGPDKVIKHNEVKIGGKKSLVYYEGRPPNGTKSNWMMHEYVVEGYERERLGPKDMKLDDYVLCKIYNKHERGKEIKKEVSDQKPHVASNDLDGNLTTDLQHARMASNQVQHPNQNSIHVTYHVENNLPTTDSNQHMINPSVTKEVEQLQRQVMVPDQQPHLIFHHNVNPSINLQVNNNVRMQKLSNFYNTDMGSPYGRVPINMSPPQPFQITNSPIRKTQLVNHTFATRFNQHKQLLPNHSPYFPPQWSPHPNLSQNMHVDPEIYHFSSPPQAAPPALQEGNDCEEQDVNTCIENMSTKDGNYILLNPDIMFDVDDQIIDLWLRTKPEGPRDEDTRKY